ncbi:MULTISPECIES: DegT/DnrJ/EryC1/StrS aminotransferase family protein [unclassified Massilia]|uniref:DegT/DnrJ/EryC1/StrS family aminotransferase n=1 Tax=unclassified Massilia TaxID=2609279 RepID=UPI00177ABD1C|nr:MULTISPECIES: DegT/DnrJ/EryC1/StrS family aminotransferase [unclassified Massilia]MBD8531142.1 DegT/DnrJ/EryC1/StrS family aminotransferase [Massilia sp. CFBP 13647]MBD8674978.1 DegT/DnrJ/EryC1/StrS family aminotransferase [Massilia sp. CFBP 13721]
MDDHQLAEPAATPATTLAAAPATATAAPPFLPFALPDIGEEEIAAVVECLRSGWVTTGPTARRFEAAFRDYLGADVQAISVNSATAGLHLALESLGIGPGDEVIVPTLTFTATAEVVRYLGAQPVLVDVDAVTLNMDPRAVEAAITPRTRAIVPVHYAGMACDMDALLALARRHELRVVEDAAHAFPTRYRGRLVGTLESDITVFSFYANKTMTTGEGGMVVVRDPELARRIRLMRLHGISQDAFDRYVSKTPAWFYEVVAAGFKYNLTDIAAAIGIEQLKKIDRFLEQRQRLAARYDEALAGLPLVLPPRPEGDSTHAWHLYVVRLREDAALQRDELIVRLSELGIGTSVHFIPLHRQPYWRDNCVSAPERFPVAEAAFGAMLTLPLYTRMTDASQERVIHALHELLPC